MEKINKIVFEPVSKITREQWVRISTTRIKNQQDKINEIIEHINKNIKS